jgi:Mrp family chromosome partitioning ATPase
MPAFAGSAWTYSKESFSNMPVHTNPDLQAPEFVMPRIPGIIQTKGGAGRSTLATNLAAHFSFKEPSTLIDCDMSQGTSSSSYALRQAESHIKHLNKRYGK